MSTALSLEEIGAVPGSNPEYLNIFFFYDFSIHLYVRVRVYLFIDMSKESIL